MTNHAPYGIAIGRDAMCNVGTNPQGLIAIGDCTSVRMCNYQGQIIGANSGQTPTTGFYNILIGANILEAGSSACAVDYSVFIGQCVAWQTQTHCNNTAIGFAALSNPGTVTCNNITIGVTAGCTLIRNFTTLIGGCNGQGLTSDGNIVISDPAPSVANVAGGIRWQVTCTNLHGIWCNAPPERLSLVGNMFVTAEIIAYYSDRRLKDNIIVIDCALDKITKLQGVKYNPNELAQKYGFDNKNEIGLLADEVEKEFPTLVKLAPFDMTEDKKSKSGENYKTIKYDRLVPVLVQSINELISEVDELEKELQEI